MEAKQAGKGEGIHPAPAVILIKVSNRSCLFGKAGFLCKEYILQEMFLSCDFQRKRLVKAADFIAAKWKMLLIF